MRRPDCTLSLKLRETVETVIVQLQLPDAERIIWTGLEKVSDHETIDRRKFFKFPENIFPTKKNCNNLDKRRKSEENSQYNLMLGHLICP
jgi:hypothetical protein